MFLMDVYKKKLLFVLPENTSKDYMLNAKPVHEFEVIEDIAQDLL
jgi:hypothetical protein